MGTSALTSGGYITSVGCTVVHIRPSKYGVLCVCLAVDYNPFVALCVPGDMTAGQAVQWIETGCDITKKGKVIVKKSAVSMSAEKTEKPEKTEKTEKMEKFPEPDKYDTALFEQLRSLRAEIARRRNIKPYVVLTDVALRSLAGYKPDTEFALYHLKGFGDVTVERYGKAVLAVVAGMPFAEAVGLVAFDSDLGTN
eukprot:TRINITY_DN2379_c0_g1_i1.p2 TRINITY_DN2379_c0_g1~~TRINITY_DN2379_c0_g1_i1.p2  ORF type:complete len:196 (+),score=31.97 TRINITY_DN2379_c0_g1_i1:625-1212(+)